MLLLLFQNWCTLEHTQYLQPCTYPYLRKLSVQKFAENVRTCGTFRLPSLVVAAAAVVKAPTRPTVEKDHSSSSCCCVAPKAISLGTLCAHIGTQGRKWRGGGRRRERREGACRFAPPWTRQVSRKITAKNSRLDTQIDVYKKTFCFL